MRMDALEQSGKAFAEDSGKIFLAMHVIFEVAEYSRKNGFLVLSRDEYFRDGQPHILDVLEKKEYISVPLKRYLVFGLECVSSGTDADEMEEILSNRCYASSYTGTDIFIAYIYKLGIKVMQEGCNCSYMLNCFRSLVPDDAEDNFEAFADKLMAGYSETGRVRQFIPEGKM